MGKSPEVTRETKLDVESQLKFKRVWADRVTVPEVDFVIRLNIIACK